MTIDLDRFKALKPWRDITFYVALLATLPVLVPLVMAAWESRIFPTGAQLGAAVAPITAWLVMHGIIRYGSVRAAGDATAAAMPEAAKQAALHADIAIDLDADAIVRAIRPPADPSDPDIDDDDVAEAREAWILGESEDAR